MQRRLVSVPIAQAELSAITGDPVLTERVAYTVTPELLAALEYRPQDTEAAEYAALVLASVAALSRYGQRLVLVAEVPEQLVQPGSDPANGECRMAEVPTGAITCWFSDEPDLDVSAAAAAAHGLSVDDAWEQPSVAELINTHQLLWSDVAEYHE